MGKRRKGSKKIEEDKRRKTKERKVKQKHKKGFIYLSKVIDNDWILSLIT